MRLPFDAQLSNWMCIAQFGDEQMSIVSSTTFVFKGFQSRRPSGGSSGFTAVPTKHAGPMAIERVFPLHCYAVVTARVRLRFDGRSTAYQIVNVKVM